MIIMIVTFTPLINRVISRDSVQIGDISAAIKLLSLQAVPGTESSINTPRNSPRHSPLTTVREGMEGQEMGKLDGVPMSVHVLLQGKLDINYQPARKLDRTDSGKSIKSIQSNTSAKGRRPAHTRTLSQDSGFEEGIF